jgi:hypothetical protein
MGMEKSVIRDREGRDVEERVGLCFKWQRDKMMNVIEMSYMCYPVYFESLVMTFFN